MRYVTIECDHCHTNSGPQLPENHVVLAGWVVDKGRDICPGCWWDMAPAPQRKQAS